MRKLVIWSFGVLALIASAAVANAAGQGSDFSVGFSHGTGEYSVPVTTAGAPLVSPYINPAPPWGELGVNAEYGMKMSDDDAFVVGFDYRLGSVKQEPTTNAAAGSPTVKVTSTAWKVRVGGDRMGKIGDKFSWFMGPGLEYGSGKAKYENVYGPPNASIESEPTNKFGINGRLGGVMKLTDAVGIRGQVGNTFGMASVKDEGGKTTWYYSSFESTWGLQFAFGGK